MATAILSTDNLDFLSSAATQLKMTATASTLTFSGVSSADVILTGLAAPSSDKDATNKAYVDSIATGLYWKAAVDVSTTTSGTLSTSFANGQSVDGVTLSTGQRILIKNQVNGIENGIYVVQASGAPVRASDYASGASVAATAVFVQQGTTNGDSGWVCTNNSGSDVVGTDSLVFVQFTGTNTIVAGSGLSKTGNTLSVVVDNSSIEIGGSGLNVKAAGVTNNMLVNDFVVVSPGDGLSNGGSVSLGGSITLDVDSSVVRTTGTQTIGGVKTFSSPAGFAAGAAIPDSQTLEIGTGADLSISHDGTDSLIANTTGDLIVSNSNTTGAVNVVLGTQDGATTFAVQDSTSSNLFVVAGDGGVGIVGATNIADTTQSTSSSTGCLTLGGGLGVAKDVNVAGAHKALSYEATSDATLKTDILPLQDPLSTLRKIEGYTYKWANNADSRQHFGVLAQQLESIGLGDMVSTNSQGKKAVNYNELVPYLIESVKILAAQVETLSK